MEDENVLISDEKGENEEGADDTGSGENTITQVAANALLNSMNVETTDDAGEKEQGTLLESQQDNSDSQVVISVTFRLKCRLYVSFGLDQSKSTPK